MNRIQTSVICHMFFVVVCLSHVSGNDTNYEDIESYSETEETTAVATTEQSYRRSKTYRRGYQGGQDDSYHQDDHHGEHHDDMMEYDDKGDMKAMVQPKVDYWGGYYDFLINEGSYKFWAVFQLATAALLIYSGFAALYYAKVNPPTSDDEFDDIFRRRRKRRSLSILSKDKPFSGLDSATFQRIIDAVARELH